MRALDGQGELQRGDREVVEAEAAVVRRIFRQFAAGEGPRAIAKRLNTEGVPDPGGALWIDTATLRGDLDQVLSWTAAREGRSRTHDTSGLVATGVSVSMGAGTRTGRYDTPSITLCIDA